MTLVEQPARRPTPSLLDSSVRLGYEWRMEAKSRIEEGPGPSTARELQAVLHAAREGAPFLVYRDPAGVQRIVRFGSERSELTLGRNPTADLSIGWDDQVSALHAVIDRLAGEALVRDPERFAIPSRGDDGGHERRADAARVLRLAAKADHELGQSAQASVQELDGEGRAVDVDGLVDVTHRAAAEERADAVPVGQSTPCLHDREGIPRLLSGKSAGETGGKLDEHRGR